MDRRVLGALLLAASVFFVQNAASSPYRSPWDWGGRDVTDLARITVADAIPADATVRASPSMATLLAERRDVSILRDSAVPDPAGAGRDVDVVVVDASQFPDWTAVDRQVFRQGLESLGFARTYDQQGLELFTRRTA